MRYKWQNQGQRNLKWFRQAYKDIAAQPYEKVNWNAYTFSWFHQMYSQIWEHRSANGRRLDPNTFLDRFSKAIGLKIVHVVPRGIGARLFIPAAHAGCYKDGGGQVYWVCRPEFEEYREAQEIKWCPRGKEWYLRSAFKSFYTIGEDGKKKQDIAAGASTFQCPVCKLTYEKLPAILRKNSTTKVQCCRWCKDAKITNQPLTQKTIYLGYHGHRTIWTFYPERYPRDTSVPIGVELEMQFHNGDVGWRASEEAWRLHQIQKEINPEWNLFYCEADGSLGNGGIEMITQPMTRRLHSAFWKAMLPRIRERFTGWNTEKHSGDSQYGIHLTFDIEEFGQFNLTRMIKFVENEGNKVLVQGIAQRGKLYGATGYLAEKTKKVKEIVKYKGTKMSGCFARSAPFNIKADGQLCEMRMFRSTLNRNSFLKNLQFIYAFHEWCSATPFNVSHLKFLEWLHVNGDALYARYASLYKYLAYPVFPVKLAQWSTENPWASRFSDVVLRNRKGQRDMFQTTYIPNDTDYK